MLQWLRAVAHPLLLIGPALTNTNSALVVPAACVVASQQMPGHAVAHWHSPVDSRWVTEAQQADAALVARAVGQAQDAAPAMAKMSGLERAAGLLRVADAVRADAESLAGLMARETGKTLREARTELQRADSVLRLCAEEATRIQGRHIPLDASALGHGRMAVSQRFPLGVVALIVPFNAPINLSCHKLGPALATGNPFVLKSPPEAAGTVSRLFEHVRQAGFPAGAVNLVHGGAEVGRALVDDERVAFISFTGSLGAGRAVKAAAGLRPCVLELGGVGPTLVHADADLTAAARACAAAGFRLAGQSCASVQNIFAHHSVADRFEELLLQQVQALRVGDPLDERTDLGPVIHEAAARRIVASVQAAVATGALLRCGGGRDGLYVQPTVLAQVDWRSPMACQEIFGPVVNVHRYADVEAVIEWVRHTRMGINLGLFTSSIELALHMHRHSQVGAVVLNASSTFRPDQLPYGGDGLSGYGRECPAESVRAMTRERILVL